MRNGLPFLQTEGLAGTVLGETLCQVLNWEGQRGDLIALSICPP